MEKTKADKNKGVCSLKNISYIVLPIFLLSASQQLSGAIIFSDTKGQMGKTELMLMFREAHQIYRSSFSRKLDGSYYHIIHAKNDLFMFKSGFFEVYHWQNSKWKLISQNRKGGYNYGSRNFAWNGRIFSYGGYGYWVNHGDLIEFDTNSGTWNKIELNKTLPTGPSYVTEYGFNVLSDSCYEVHLANKTVHVYPIDLPMDFNIGELWSSAKSESSNWTWLLQGGENLFHHKKENTFYYSNVSTQGHENKRFIGEGEMFQFKNDSLIKWSADGKITGTLKIDDMVKHYKRCSIHDPDKWTKYTSAYLGLGLGAIIIISIWASWRRRKSFKEQKWQNSFITTILNAKNTVLNTEQLDTIIGVAGILPLEYRKYRRSRIVHDINAEFRKKNGYDLITRDKDPEDGRKYLYKIDHT